MNRFRAWLFRLGELFQKERRDRDLSAEMDSHLQLHIEDNLHAGMSRAEAQRQALVKLGGVEQTKEMVRDRRALPLLECLLYDLRYGARTLLNNPRLTFVRAPSLALGLGVTTRVFTRA